MKIPTKIIFLLIALIVSTYPQNKETKWYKGNLHTHSLWSDGDDFPEMIIDWYKQHGYDFIALSDHNILAKGEKWIKVESSMMEGYSLYFKKFKDEWIESKYVSDTLFVRLKTLEEYRKLFEEPGKFLIIQSEEITDRFEKKPIHVNAPNIEELIEPQGGNSVLEVMQNDVNAVNEQRERTGISMFPHINHPNYGWAVTGEDLINLEGDKFFEIYNGHPLVNNYGDSIHPGTEEMWDMVLSERLSNGKDLMYGLAVDDAHNYFEYNSGKSNPGRGWVMVKADTLTPESIIIAMEKGDFYASTGVKIKNIEIYNDRIKISVISEGGINYKIRFIGTLKDCTTTHKFGELLKEVSDSDAEYQFAGNEMYVRAVIISSKLKVNPYKEGEFEVAWIQPVLPP
jgi:hypothetical protein